ncbi:MAG TPA: hypothetical protein VHA74_00035 [Candidatus Dojkabacteria bacterium]|nr:hypothetical protein [Candidatus Dojkabacteria bacterium]
MKKIFKVINKVENYDFTIPLDGSLNLHVKKGDSITPRKPIMTKEYKKVLSSFYIPKELGSNIKESADFIVRLNGEYVTKGETLAERLTTGGLSVKRIVANNEGILSLSRIDSGFIDILGENTVEEVHTQFYGKVVDIDVNTGIVVQANALSLEGIGNAKSLETNSGKSQNHIRGEFTLIKNGDSIYTVKDLEESYEGKIVYAGKFVYPELINQLYLRGAMHVVVYSMNYMDYSDLKVPVTLLGGFGNLGLSDLYTNVLEGFKGLICVVDYSNDTSKVVFPDNGQHLSKITLTTKEVAVLHEGMYVIVKDTDMFNVKARILELNSEEHVALIATDNGKRALLSESNLIPLVY